MKYKIMFSSSARKDNLCILRYISEQLLEPVIAEKLVKRILEEIKLLNEFPMRYRLYSTRKSQLKGLRALPVENYIVFYIVDEVSQTVKVYRVLYGKRNISTLL